MTDLWLKIEQVMQTQIISLLRLSGVLLPLMVAPLMCLMKNMNLLKFYLMAQATKYFRGMNV